MSQRETESRPELFLTFEEFSKVPAWAQSHIAAMDPEKVRYAFLDAGLSVNLNATVRAKLNDEGLRQLRAAPHTEALIKYNLNGDLLECTLWQYLQVFGPFTHQGTKVPTEKNCIVILPQAVSRPVEPTPAKATRRAKKGGRS